MKNLKFKGKTNVLNNPTKIFIYKSLVELVLNQEGSTLDTGCDDFLVDVQDVLKRLEKEIKTLEDNSLKEKAPAKSSLRTAEQNRELGKILVTLLTTEYQNGTQLASLDSPCKGLSSQKLTSVFKTIDSSCYDFKKIKGVNHYRLPQ